MRPIDQMIDQLRPMIEAIKADLNNHPGFVCMKRVVKRLRDELNLSANAATQVVMACKITINDREDAEKAADFLFEGLEIAARLVTELNDGKLCVTSLIEAARTMSVEC